MKGGRGGSWLVVRFVNLACRWMKKVLTPADRGEAAAPQRWLSLCVRDCCGPADAEWVLPLLEQAVNLRQLRFEGPPEAAAAAWLPLDGVLGGLPHLESLRLGPLTAAWTHQVGGRGSSGYPALRTVRLLAGPGVRTLSPRRLGGGLGGGEVRVCWEIPASCAAADPDPPPPVVSGGVAAAAAGDGDGDGRPPARKRARTGRAPREARAGQEMMMTGVVLMVAGGLERWATSGGARHPRWQKCVRSRGGGGAEAPARVDLRVLCGPGEAPYVAPTVRDFLHGVAPQRRRVHVLITEPGVADTAQGREALEGSIREALGSQGLVGDISIEDASGHQPMLRALRDR